MVIFSNCIMVPTLYVSRKLISNDRKRKVIHNINLYCIMFPKLFITQILKKIYKKERAKL